MTPPTTTQPDAATERPPGARTIEPSDSTRARWARMGKLVDSAKAEGQAEGERTGYRQGWRWGLCCGVVAGVLITSAAWSLWLTVTAPSAAPTSASPARLLT